ncbi:MAG: hypothetical protein EA351_14450 [Gemmatimonadales bacterium]|nr:MAG: hypothetical protein EA351_14450 [Gemmatimonadales bacterium]
MPLRVRTALTPILILLAFGCSDSVTSESCEPGPYFTHLPVDGEAIRYFLVLGQFNPPGDVFPRGQTGLQLLSPALTPAYAVGDVDVIHVESTHWIASPTRQGHTDYAVGFRIPECPAITGQYGHLADLEPHLQAELSGAQCEIYSTIDETIESCETRLRIPVSAGTVLGQAGGTITGLDFDLFDDRVTFDYVAAHRYPMAWRAICPQPLFVPPLRDFLLERTGRGETVRTAEPRCGTMEIDLPGTAQGMWTEEGHDLVLGHTTYDRFFALAPDDIRPDQFNILVTAHPAFAVDPHGHVIFAFEYQPEGRLNRRFADLPADGTLFCYEPVREHPDYFRAHGISFLFALGADERVTVERRDHAWDGSPCTNESPETWAFSEAAVRLMR